MDEDRAIAQDIRPFNIAILNLMPEKEKTEITITSIIRKYTATSKCDIFTYGNT